MQKSLALVKKWLQEKAYFHLYSQNLLSQFSEVLGQFHDIRP